MSKIIYSLKLVILLEIFVISLENAYARTPTGCSIKLPTDIPENEPIYLVKNRRKYEIFKPDNQINYISKNKTLTLYCPGRRNYLNNKNMKNSVTLKCVNGNSFENVDSFEKENLKNLFCNKNPTADLKITTDKCASDQGYLYEIGFKLEEKFLTIFKICYNNQTEETFYSVNEINGGAIKYSVKENKRREFKSSGMLSASSDSVRRIYNQQNQKQRFEKLFGTEQKYINSTIFLARGHLTPDADFVFPSAQLATYFYVNVAPQFQIVNTGNWKRVENLAKDLAFNYKSDFEIHTGIHGVLELKDPVTGILVPVYLDNEQKLEVPKYFWKVIKNINSNSAIAIVTLNDPFADEVDEFCPNVCKRASLDSKHFKNIRKGYTICCEIAEFKKIINDLPENFAAKNLLNCANAKLD